MVKVADPDGLRDALGHALGVKVVVEKKRRLFLWQTVRIHLDEVVGLGRFLELEAVVSEESDLPVAYERVRQLRACFQIGQDQLVADSYSDLLVLEPGRPETR